ncbi:kinase-like domain-containing protein [Fomes fomentarius]|nr:kinase-like domain-containing protein [Fomes fomentarius]
MDDIWVRLQDLSGFFQRLLIIGLTRPLQGTHNIRTFYFNIPWIVKVTKRTTSTEAHALRYLHSMGLDIPIPKLIFSCVYRGTTYTVMTRVPGRNMHAIANDITPDVIQTIASEVSTVLNKLDTLRQAPSDAGKVMMSASGHNLPDPVFFFEERSGPYISLIELWVHCGEYSSIDKMQDDVDVRTLDIMAADPIRYVHPDLRCYNIIVRDGHLSGIIDWEDSGWFPSSWQVHTMRWPRVGCSGPWLQYWLRYRFSKEAEAAYAASKSFLIKSPV